MKKSKVLLAMSGGVDSSVAAILLLNSGYDVSGATMVMVNDKIINNKLINDSKLVARQLKIKHYVIDCKREFYNNVIHNFVTEYSSGHTPNPCVVCNKIVKFGLFLEYAKKMNFDYISTGHYAGIIYDNITDEYILKKSDFESKDQSYVLYNLTQDIMPQILFPLTKYSKEEVRKIAQYNNLTVKNKPESQDICFIPDGDYVSFLEKITSKKSPVGSFVDESGFMYGKHKGIWNYTIGQRKGLGLSFNKKMFVSNINSINNNITLSDKDPMDDKLVVKDVNIISPKRFKDNMVVDVKIRYKHQQKPAKIFRQTNRDMLVIFDQPQRAITKGQSAVFYENNIVIGGGIIK